MMCSVARCGPCVCLAGLLVRLIGAGASRRGGFRLFAEQVLANGVTMVYSFVVTALVMLALKYTIGIRVDAEVEDEGLDLTEHAEEGYVTDRPSVVTV